MRVGSSFWILFLSRKSIDFADKAVIDLDILLSSGIRSRRRLMDHDPFDQVVQHRGGQLLRIGILLDDGHPSFCVVYRLPLLAQLGLHKLNFVGQRRLLCLILFGEHIEVVLRDLTADSILIELGEEAIQLGLALFGLVQLRGLFFRRRCPFAVAGVQEPLQQAVLIRLRQLRPILDAGEDIGVERVISDIVLRAARPISAVLTVGGAAVVGVGGTFPGLVGSEAHGSPAAAAFQQTGEDLDAVVLGAAVSARYLLLYLLKQLRTDDRLVGVFDPDPFLFRVAYHLLVFVGDAVLLVVDAVSDIGLVRQDVLDGGVRPMIRLLPGIVSVDVGKRPVPLVMEPARGGDFFFGKDLDDLVGAITAGSQPENALHDPSGLLVHDQLVRVVGVFFVAKRSVGAQVFAGAVLGLVGRFDLAAGVLGQPFIEQVFEGDKVAQAPLCVLVVGDGYVADALFREHKFQIVVHHHMLTPEAGQVLRDDAVDPPRVHVGHHAPEAGPLEIRAAPAIVDVLVIDAEAVFLGIRLQNGALGLDGNAVAVVLIIHAQSHI